MNKIAQQRKRHYLRWIVMVSLVILAVIILLNRVWTYDWLRSVAYQPTTEIIKMREDLSLTEQGEFLFNAVQPELNGAEEFNTNCRQDEDEVVVLGCYARGNIYVYDIVSDELSGIRELTLAHELLHAVWARMNENERRSLTEPLTMVFEKNQEMLEEEINSYDISEKQEELYVRVGTEIRDLPEVLEKHFAEIFEDQNKVVGFYDSYIAVFREIKAQMERLLNEMGELKDEIDAKMVEHEADLVDLDVDVESFNSCAETVGCFTSEEEFYRQRNALIARENALNALNDEINGLIDTYNEKVNEYNANVTESRKMQNMINSKAESVEIR